LKKDIRKAKIKKTRSGVVGPDKSGQHAWPI